MGCSVEALALRYEQPLGGFIRPSRLSSEFLDGKLTASELKGGNVQAAVAARAADMLCRRWTGVEEAGTATVAPRHSSKVAANDPEAISGRGTGAAKAAVRLASDELGITTFPANQEACESILEMAARELACRTALGGTSAHGLDLAGAYTDGVTSGGAWAVCGGTLVLPAALALGVTKEKTLELAMVWRMGLRSKYAETFGEVRELAAFDPRRNLLRRIACARIAAQTVKSIERDVIGYGD